jgi:hypothetical protein
VCTTIAKESISKRVPVKNQSVIHINPYILEQLKNVKLPIQQIDDLTKGTSKEIYVFSDYGPENAEYDVYAYYLVNSSVAEELFAELEKIKTSYNISGRTIQYKGRKDNLKRKAFMEWLNKVKTFPGFIYIIAFDNSQSSNKIEVIKKYKEELKIHQIQENPKICERIAKSLCFFEILHSYLDSHHKLMWVSDQDDLMANSQRQLLLGNSLIFSINNRHQLDSKFSPPEIIIPSKEKGTWSGLFNELLSISDIAASSIGSALKKDRNPPLRCQDEEAIEMIEELFKMPSIESWNLNFDAGCFIGVAIFDAEKINEEPHYVLKSAQMRTQEQRVELLRKANILDADGYYVEQFFSSETVKKDRARREK